MFGFRSGTSGAVKMNFWYVCNRSGCTPNVFFVKHS